MILKKVLGFLELEEEGHGIIMGVTRLLLLGPFYYIAINGQPKSTGSVPQFLEKKQIFLQKKVEIETLVRLV